MNILTNSDVYAGLSQGHFLSPSGGCKTWDEGADGYCRSGMRLTFHPQHSVIVKSLTN